MSVTASKHMKERAVYQQPHSLAPQFENAVIVQHARSEPSAPSRRWCRTLINAGVNRPHSIAQVTRVPEQQQDQHLTVAAIACDAAVPAHMAPDCGSGMLYRVSLSAATR